MRPISMNENGWYQLAYTTLHNQRKLTIVIGQKNDATLYQHFVDLSDSGRGGGYRTLFYMVRYRGLHRLMFSAVALGLGVSLERTQGGELVVRMNETLGMTAPTSEPSCGSVLVSATLSRVESRIRRSIEKRWLLVPV